MLWRDGTDMVRGAICAAAGCLGRIFVLGAMWASGSGGLPWRPRAPGSRSPSRHTNLYRRIDARREAGAAPASAYPTRIM